MSWKDRLLEIARETGAFQTGEFTFSSGSRRKYYFDGRVLTLHPEALWHITQWIWRHLPNDIQAIGGPTLGADAAVGAIVYMAYNRGGPSITGFLVRREPKTHGTLRMIEGNLPPGSKVALFDDTITTGKSLLSAIKVVEERGCKVAIILTLADWQEGGSGKLKEMGYRFEALFNLDPLRGITIAKVE
ncbi:MAG TPA: orotate phosphoribosyltransferase [Candidatus Paceibacterota bacterium]